MKWNIEMTISFLRSQEEPIVVYDVVTTHRFFLGKSLFIPVFPFNLSWIFGTKISKFGWLILRSLSVYLWSSLSRNLKLINWLFSFLFGFFFFWSWEGSLSLRITKYWKWTHTVRSFLNPGGTLPHNSDSEYFIPVNC